MTHVKNVLQTAPVAGAHSYWLGSVQGGWEWERSPHKAFVRSTSDGPIARSNHCLFEFHQQNEGLVPSTTSKSRLKRAKTILETGSHNFESLKTIFSNRQDGIYSINRYPEDNQGTTTNAVVVALPKERTLYACKGPADRGQWVQLQFERTL